MPRKVTPEKIAASKRKRVAVEGPTVPVRRSENDEPSVIVACNVETVRVGCAIIQAAMGGTVLGPHFQTLFPTETWTTNPAGVSSYRTPVRLLGALSNKVRRAHGLRPLPEDVATDIVSSIRRAMVAP